MPQASARFCIEQESHHGFGAGLYQGVQTVFLEAPDVDGSVVGAATKQVVHDDGRKDDAVWHDGSGAYGGGDESERDVGRRTSVVSLFLQVKWFNVPNPSR